MDAEDTVREYYEALRRGDPLAPFFADGESTVKFGVRESLFGAETVREALREQTATTDAWTVESRTLVVEERDGWAWFADEVGLAWTDRETGDRRRFDTRWSGTLERRSADSSETRTDDSPPEARAEGSSRGDGAAEDDDEGTWRFVSMHVSAPQAVE